MDTITANISATILANQIPLSPKRIGIIEAKGSAREEYLLPLIREKDPLAVRSF